MPSPRPTMPLRLDANLPGQSLGDPAAAGSAPRQSGTLLGTGVTVKDQLSILTDAAEEMSFHLSDKVEAKTHEERKVHTPDRLRAMTIQQVQDYFEKARKLGNPQELAALARRLLQARGDELGQLLRSNPRLHDATDRFLVLQYAQALGRDEGLPPQALAGIEDALADLESWFGDAIRTNLATIEPASKYADTAQEVEQFQASVHDVLGSPTIRETLQQVLQLAGRSGAKLDKAATNLMDALGACLATAGSAAEKALLEALVTDLFHLKSINTLLAGCRELLRRLRRLHGGGDEEETEDEDPSAPGTRAGTSPPLDRRGVTIPGKRNPSR